METKFTKGGWTIKNPIAEYDSYSNMWFVVIWSESDRIIQRIYGSTKSEAEANAKLIAAAPDLLKELVQLRKWVCALKDWAGGTSLDPDIESVDAVIKKATE